MDLAFFELFFYFVISFIFKLCLRRQNFSLILHFLRLYLIRKPFSLLRTIDFAGKDGSKVTTVVATPGQGPDRPQEVSYSDTKVIGNGSFGVVFQAKLCDNGELVAIKKVLQDKRFKVG